MSSTGATEWVRVCPLSALVVERGAAALVRGEQVALFRTYDGALYGVGNRDPFSGAHVISRGIVGTRSGCAFVASPMHKQAFDLSTGRCLDDPTVALPVWRVRVVDDEVQVAVPA